MNTNPNQYILILGGDYMLRERIFAGAVRASNGMPVLTMAKSRASTTLKFFDGYIMADMAIPEVALAAVKQYEQEHQCTPAAVIPINDVAVRSAASISAHYKINHNSEDCINKCRDKFLMKQTLSAAGLPVPRFGEFANLPELIKLIDEIGLPVVIKPREFGGSIGVMKITSKEQIEPTFLKCEAEVKACSKVYNTPEDTYVVEEYIDSRVEVSVEVINHGDVHRVIAITDKCLGEEPFFVEIGHSVPSIHTDNQDLRTIAEKACAALGIRFGIAHFEARIKASGEIRIIEVGARTGGDAIMDLVERTYGINPYQLHTASYLGIAPQLPEQLIPRGLSAVSFLKAREGVIEKVTIPHTLPENIVHLHVIGKPKDYSGKPTSWHDREGVLEFFWKNRAPEKGFDEHLRIANQLADEIFTVRLRNQMSEDRGQ